MASLILAVTAPDKTDYVLIAYKFTDAQQASFNNRDGAGAPFWSLLFNNTILKISGHVTNLHSLWDNLIRIKAKE